MSFSLTQTSYCPIVFWTLHESKIYSVGFIKAGQASDFIDCHWDFVDWNPESKDGSVDNQMKKIAAKIFEGINPDIKSVNKMGSVNGKGQPDPAPWFEVELYNKAFAPLLDSEEKVLSGGKVVFMNLNEFLKAIGSCPSIIGHPFSYKHN